MSRYLNITAYQPFCQKFGEKDAVMRVFSDDIYKGFLG
jgi:hypothetical protein